MFEKFEEEVRNCLKDVLDMDFKLEEPKGKYGDLSTNVAFKLAKQYKRNPIEIADELISKMNLSKFKYIEDVKNINGYINFYINYNIFAKELIDRVKKEGENYGRGKKKGEKVVIEHTSANPDGPLHIGHLRNAIIGDSLARILRFYGYDVETQYYVNDMGRQIAILVFGIKKFGLNKDKKKDHAIAEVYIKSNEYLERNKNFFEEIRRIMKEYEEGKNREEIRRIVDHCLEGIRETLNRLDIVHDRFIYESDFVYNGDVERVIEILKNTKYYRENDVCYLDLKEFGIDKELILKRSDGTTLYITRDIAYHLYKLKNFDIVIDIFGSDHKLAAKQLSTVLKILNERTPKFIIYEFITLPEGKLSTRKGTYIAVDDLIEECVKKAYEEVTKRRKDLDEDTRRKIAENLGIGSLKFYIARVSYERRITFNWNEVLNFERNSLPYIQYAYARICRILEKARVPENYEVKDLNENEKSLIKIVSKFPKIVKESAENLQINIIANYMIEVADAFHRFYNSDRIIGSEKEDFRLNLIYSVKVVLENSMSLLGIKPLNML